MKRVGGKIYLVLATQCFRQTTISQAVGGTTVGTTQEGPRSDDSARKRRLLEHRAQDQEFTGFHIYVLVQWLVPWVVLINVCQGTSCEGVEVRSV